MDTSEHRCWLLQPYGAPTASSEVSRVGTFYSSAALSVCGPGGAFGLHAPEAAHPVVSEPEARAA